VLGFSVVSWVSRPLRLISQTLKTEQVGPIRKLRGNKSEFGGLSKLIQEFFDQRASLIAEITERKSTQEALRASEEQLRQSQKMEAVGRLAGGIAHDFNNLLTVILGYSELLASTPNLAPASKQSVEMIQKAGRQAAAVTHQLLAFSRKQMLQPRIIDLNALLTDFEKILRRVIGEHIELKTHPDADSSRVKADPNQIEQVILNLGVNARDAMPKGGRMLIRTANVEFDTAAARAQAPDLSPGCYVLLEVSDTGQGMTDEVKSRIFEPFFTTKEPGKGTGLGLATVYGVVKQSGGSLTVESSSGRGSTFRIYLPQQDGEIEDARPKTVAPVEATRKMAETILVVEDEEIVRDLVCQILSDYGYNVLCAANGTEALEMGACYAGKIKLLITDVVMPEIGGIELARKICAERPDIKVLYVSGYSESDISEQGILEAELEFLEKPFTPHLLLRKVREVLNPVFPPEGDGEDQPVASHASSSV
jgi:two-component system cell cycle sensor histidine kinase/response regulator CckA